MPITQIPKPSTPSDIVASNTPSVGQILSANGTEFTWVTNDAAVTTAEFHDFVQDIKRRGFLDNNETDIPYLSGAQNDIVNLDDKGAGWSYFFDGYEVYLSGNKTVALTGGAGNAHTDGIHYIYINDDTGALKCKTAPFNFTEEVLVAAVAWDSSLPSGSRSAISDERHTCKWDSDVHKYIHYTIGTKLFSGGDLSGLVLNSNTDANKQPAISQAVIFDEDLSFTLDELAAGNEKYALSFRTGIGVWGWSLNNNVPFRYTVNGRMNYGDGTITGAEMTNGYYINIYVLLTNITGQLRHTFISSQTEYPILSAANSASFSDIDLTGFVIPEYVVSHKMTFKTDDTFSGMGKCQLVKVIDYTANAIDTLSGLKDSPEVVNPSVVGNFVSFSDITGGQQDSGKKAADFQTVLTKGDLTSANNKIGVTGGTASVIGSGAALTLNESNVVHQNLSGAGTNTHTNIDSHISSTSNPHSVTASQSGAPALVNPSVNGNFVSFNGIAGLQQDSGKKAADFEPTLTKGNLTAASNKIAIVGGTGSVIGSGATVDVTEANIVHQSISGAGTNTHTQIDSFISGSGTMRTQNSNNISVTGGTMSGVTITGAASENLLITGGTMTGRINTVASTAVDGSGLRLPIGVVPNSPVDGDVWYDNVQKNFAIFMDGVRQGIKTNLFVKTSSTTVTASVTNAETSLAGTGLGTLTIPADFLTVGKTISFKCDGVFTTSNNSATMIFRFKCGTSILAATASLDANNNLTNGQWHAEGSFTCFSTGAGGFT